MNNEPQATGSISQILDGEIRSTSLASWVCWMPPNSNPFTPMARKPDIGESRAFGFGNEHLDRPLSGYSADEIPVELWHLSKEQIDARQRNRLGSAVPEALRLLTRDELYERRMMQVKISMRRRAERAKRGLR